MPRKQSRYVVDYWPSVAAYLTLRLTTKKRVYISAANRVQAQRKFLRSHPNAVYPELRWKTSWDSPKWQFQADTMIFKKHDNKMRQRIRRLRR